MHAVGWLDGGLTSSFEKFILDVENLAMFTHFLDGFAVDEASLAIGMMAEVGPGGHHFGTAHTLVPDGYRCVRQTQARADIRRSVHG
jgi:trimethylamine--corrinoid protein Co-methyltransferase